MDQVRSGGVRLIHISTLSSSSIAKHYKCLFMGLLVILLCQGHSYCAGFTTYFQLLALHTSAYSCTAFFEGIISTQTAQPYQLECQQNTTGHCDAHPGRY